MFIKFYTNLDFESHSLNKTSTLIVFISFRRGVRYGCANRIYTCKSEWRYLKAKRGMGWIVSVLRSPLIVLIKIKETVLSQ